MMLLYGLVKQEIFERMLLECPDLAAWPYIFFWFLIESNGSKEKLDDFDRLFYDGPSISIINIFLFKKDFH